MLSVSSPARDPLGRRVSVKPCSTPAGPPAYHPLPHRVDRPHGSRAPSVALAGPHGGGHHNRSRAAPETTTLCQSGRSRCDARSLPAWRHCDSRARNRPPPHARASGDRVLPTCARPHRAPPPAGRPTPAGPDRIAPAPLATAGPVRAAATRAPRRQPRTAQARPPTPPNGPRPWASRPNSEGSIAVVLCMSLTFLSTKPPTSASVAPMRTTHRVYASRASLDGVLASAANVLPLGRSSKFGPCSARVRFLVGREGLEPSTDGL